MFFQSTNEKCSDNKVTTVDVPRRNPKKKKNKSARKNKKNFMKKKLALSMSSWAENFTTAATWQLKHQLAYWKAKAVSLEYENQILHDIIRKNCSQIPSGSSNVESDVDLTSDQISKRESAMSAMYESDSDSDSLDDNDVLEVNTDDNEFVVSEEFIQFVQANAKYKEDARLEREKFKAKLGKKECVQELEAGPSMPREDKSQVSKKLYGDNYKKIVALELAVQSQFIEECDKSKPNYWPNIPFNFS